MKTLKYAFVFVGTIIGAGLASGQEILQFFSMYGKKGILGILICFVLYVFLSQIIIKLSIKYKLKSYSDYLKFVLGKQFGFFSDLIITFFIFSSNVIMISGSATLLYENFGFRKNYAVIFVSLVVLIISLFSTKGLIEINSIIVPFSTLTIILLGYFVLSSEIKTFEEIVEIYKPFKSNWLFSSFIYASFNIMSIIGVFSPIANEEKNKGALIYGSLIGSLLLTIIALIINFSILSYYPQSFSKEIPNIYIAKFYGNILPNLLMIAIWLEMISTEISDIYSLAKRFSGSFNLSYRQIVLIIISVSLPFSFISFSNLIKTIYPVYGLISFILILSSLIKSLILKRHFFLN
ncbi:hypothetical protein ABG79_01467 [Caloramator mitchellensis]|uniref:Transporter n=1 Tax=Caloramator mitchellensis TaxID=908809 RepID=A0A0R3JT98_CALMK|nr:hypothetical protein [Caloramator mitchellensis]KRQ86715.1 hypothetical protein ABG79_01467 [Caloramator mitchellensis]